MELIEAFIKIFPEILKLGGWGAMLVLLVFRILVTKAEKDEAVAVERERVADKQNQIDVLTTAVKEGDASMDKLAVAWEAAIALITRQRGEKA